MEAEQVREWPFLELENLLDARLASYDSAEVTSRRRIGGYQRGGCNSRQFGNDLGAYGNGVRGRFESIMNSAGNESNF